MKLSFEKINKSALHFLQPFSLGEVETVVVEEGMRLIDAEFGSIFLSIKGRLKRVYANDSRIFAVVPKGKGLVYKCFFSHEAFWADISEVTVVKNKKILEKLSVRSLVFIPLSYHGTSIGVLTLMSTKKLRFMAKNLEILKLFGSMASLAIRKAQLDVEARQSEEERTLLKGVETTLRSIHNSGLTLLNRLTLEETYATIVKEAIRLVEGDDGFIVLQDGESLRNVYGSTKEAASVEVRQKGYTYNAITKNVAFVLSPEQFGKIHPDIAKSGIKSSAFVPLSYKKESIGALIIRTYKDRVFGGQELETLKLFSSMASLAVRKAYLTTETQKALETRDLFISMAAHELRTPLTIISGYIQMLDHKFRNQNSVEARWVEELSRESRRLVDLVNELLEKNRIHAGKLNYNFMECNISEVVDYAINSFEFSHPRRKIVFQNKIKNGCGIIAGDPNKLTQMLLNLLDNADKFSERDKEIAVFLTQTIDYYRVLVKDKGAGISSEEVNKIFDSFYRAKNHNIEGMGLGLFLVKDIVARHHGVIDVKSSLGVGTTFEIRLPKIQ